MPTWTIDGRAREYTVEGTGPTVVFVPTPGFGEWQWAWQFPAVAGPYQALTYQQRGTDAVPTGIDGLDQLVAELEELLVTEGIDRAHLVGAGLGGMIGLEYAQQYTRARSLTLLATTPGGPDAHRPHGPGAILGAPPTDRAALRQTTAAGLSADFVADNQDVIDRIVEWRASEDGTTEQWEQIDQAYLTYEREWPLYTCSLPTLLLHGTADAVVPPINTQVLAEELPRTTTQQLADAGHLITVERSRQVNDRLIGFLEEHTETERS